MNKNISATLFVIAFAISGAVPSAAFAQFKLPSIGGLGGAPAAAPAGGDLEGQQGKLVHAYVMADQTVLLANADMAEALGLKTEATTMRSTATALTDGSTKASVQDTGKAVSAGTDLVVAKLNNTAPLDEASKKLFTAGIVKLVSGAALYVEAGKVASTFSSDAASASPLQMLKLKDAVYVASNLPTSAKAVSTALHSAVKFAKDNGIPVPADTNSVL